MLSTLFLSQIVCLTCQGDAGSGAPRISADGRFVSFVSGASNLVQGDENGPVGDVFVAAVDSGLVECLSLGGDGASSGPAPISATGRFVAFNTQASNLGGAPGPYLADRLAGTLEPLPGQAVLDINADARFVALQLDTDSCGILDRRTGAIDPLPQWTSSATLSSTGRYVGFRITDRSNPNYDLPAAYVLDRAYGISEQVDDGSHRYCSAPLVSRDGRFALFQGSCGICYFDRVLGTADSLSPTAISPAMSQDGRYVGFAEQHAIHLLDNLGSPALFGWAECYEESISCDGSRVAFTSVLPGRNDSNGVNDVYVRVR